MFDQRASVYQDAVALLATPYDMTGEVPKTDEDLKRFHKTYKHYPPQDLVTRLVVFGTREATESFGHAYFLLWQDVDAQAGEEIWRRTGSREDLEHTRQQDKELSWKLADRSSAAHDKYQDFLEVVRRDLGTSDEV